jgi:exoribonuclease-2
MIRIYGSLLVQERTGEVFEATVTNANDYGVLARLDQPPVEGRLVRADARLRRGDRLRMPVTRTNWERGFVDLALVL